DKRLRQLLREREHVLAVPSAEDAVLVLEQHDVDVESSQHPRRPHVIAADGLRDRREQAAPLRTGRPVQDGDELGALDAVDAAQRSSQVRRERADPARPRRIRRDDRRAQMPGRYGRPRSGTGSAWSCCGSCRPSRVAVGFRNMPFVASRNWSSTRLRAFLMRSLPSDDSPETASGGLVRESEHGDAPPRVAERDGAPGSASYDRRARSPTRSRRGWTSSSPTYTARGGNPMGSAYPREILDWQAFTALYVPSCRRHDLVAATAYAAYRRDGTAPR